MLEILIYSYFTSIFVFSAGIFFSVNILNLKNSEVSNIFQSGLYGIIFLSFLSLFLNFFYSLNKNINTAILIFFVIYLFFNKKNIKDILLYSLIVSILCVLLLSYETTYRPDAGLYHLPYTKILNNEKIIIGLSNLHFRYGHTSIIQYVAALNNNWIFKDQGILIPLSIIYAYFLLYIIFEIKNEKNTLILFFNFIVLCFLCLKLNRYSDFGNDAPANIFYFFLTSIALKNYNKLNNSNIGELFTVAAYIIFNKITLFLGSLIPIALMFLRKKFILFNYKLFLFLVLFSFSFFAKNVLVSGCLAFPIEKTCIYEVSWYDKNSNRGSNANITMKENEAWTKGWSDQKENPKSFEEYISNLEWIKLWSKNHGIRTLNKLIPFLLILTIMTAIIYKLGNNTNSIIYKNKRIFFVFLAINVLGTMMWFLKFPVFRYGSSYIICTLAIILLLALWNKILLINYLKLKKIFIYFTIFLLFVLVTKNSIRIFKNYGQKYNDAPWPKIYSEDNYNKKQINNPVYINDKIVFYQSDKELCYYNNAPCTHLLNYQFTEKEINFKIIWGYKIFYF